MALVPLHSVTTSTLAALGFASPWWLLGASAVVLPILAHWRWGGQEKVGVWGGGGGGGGGAIPFPAVSFLQQASLQAESRRQPHHLLLLLLRCLMILLAALAFAQPSLKSGKPFTITQNSTSVKNQPEAEVVIVIDASASMQRIDRGVTLFDRARIEAQRILDQIEKNTNRTSAAIIMAGSTHPRPLIPQLGFDFNRLQDLLALEVPAFGRAEMNHTLRVAATLPGCGTSGDNSSPTEKFAHQSPSGKVMRERQVVVITDAQATEWDAFAWHGKAEAGLTFSLLRVGAEHSAIDANLSLQNAVVTPLRPILGESVRLSVEVVRGVAPGLPSTAGAISLRVRLEVADTRFERVVKNLQPGEKRSISIPTQPLETTGWLPIQWSLQNLEGGFALDDRLSAGLVVRAKRAVGILTAEWSVDQNNTARRIAVNRLTNSAILAAALMPNNDSPVQVTTLSPTDLTDSAHAEIWQKLDVIMIHEAGPLTGAVLVALDQFVLAGGGILWVLDSPSAIRAWEEFEQLRHLEQANPGAVPGNILLPFSASEWVNLADTTAKTGLALTRATDWFAISNEANHPLARLDEEAVQALLTTRVAVYASGQATPSGTTILEFENRKPAFLTARLGRGRLGLLTFPLNPPPNTTAPPTPGSLLQQPMFVPFIHEIVRWLMPDTALVEQVAVGDSIRFVLAEEIENPPQLQVEPAWAEAVFELVLKRNNQSHLQIPETAAANSRNWIVRIPSTKEPGLVQLRDSRSGIIHGLASVYLEPRESQLARLTPVAEQALLAQLNNPGEEANQSTAPPPPRMATQDNNESIFKQWLSQRVIAEGPARELWPACIVLLLLTAGLEHLLQFRVSRRPPNLGPKGAAC